MAGFDENQPRDEHGQWTAGSAKSAIIRAASDKAKVLKSKLDLLINGSDPEFSKEAFQNASPSERSNKMFQLDERMNDLGLTREEKMDVVEDFIRYEPIEHFAGYDFQGNLKIFKSGDENHVPLMPEEQRSLVGGYMTHNHPLDQSFSNGDFNSTVAMGMKEMRAASAGHDYVFRPNYGSNYDSKSDVERKMDAFFMSMNYENAIVQEIDDTVKKLAKGEIDEEEASQGLQDRAARRYAKLSGSYYAVEPKNPSLSPNKELLGHSHYDEYLGEKIINKERQIARMDRGDVANIKLRSLIRKTKQDF